jgi:hypothetical protein
MLNDKEKSFNLRSGHHCGFTGLLHITDDYCILMSITANHCRLLPITADCCQSLQGSPAYAGHGGHLWSKPEGPDRSHLCHGQLMWPEHE